MSPSCVLTVRCPSRRGIVAAISGLLAGNGCNITDSVQFDDLSTGTFFMRVTFAIETGIGIEAVRQAFAGLAPSFAMEWQIHDARRRMPVMLMVSNFGHCLNDLLYRWRIGGMAADITAVVSNHETYRKLVDDHGIPFHHIPVTAATKDEAEARLTDLIAETGTELVVLARYMQVLSDRFCASMPGRIVNIHHSFLPSFKGANPYKQAHQRGVKLIGATAHFVTADLDEGPIIEQETIRVTHAQNTEDFVSLGRDVEAQVLARAVHACVHHRVFVNGSRTVVFPTSPGGYASERMG